MRNLLCSALLSFVAASCSLTPRYSVYGADLETREGSRVIMWATSERYTEFRYVVERKGEGAERVRVLRSIGSLKSLAGEGPIAGATMMLPPDATKVQREAASSVLSELGALQPTMSTHLVVTAVPWDDVKSVEDAVERSKEARNLVLPDGDNQMGLAEIALWMQPDLMVFPMASVDGAAPDSFLVAATREERTMSFGNDPEGYEFITATTTDVLARIAAAPVTERAQRLQTAVVVLPSDADAACRAHGQRLMVQLLETADDTWVISRRTSEAVGMADLSDPDSLQQMLSGIQTSFFSPGAAPPSDQ